MISHIFDRVTLIIITISVIVNSTKTDFNTNNYRDYSKFKLTSPLVQISKSKSANLIKNVKFEEKSPISRKKAPKPKTLSWLFLAAEKNCNHEFLSQQQRDFCQKYPLLFPHIRRAAETTVRQCVNSMSQRRWDCSNLAKAVLDRDVTTTSDREMPSILRRDTAEAAFLESLSSGILSHYISLACKRENIPYCGCGDFRPTVLVEVYIQNSKCKLSH